MKVAYNACFGGFSLSAKATHEYAKRKGITLTWYEGSGSFGERTYTKTEDLSGNAWELSPLTQDLGDEITGDYPEGTYYYKSHGDAFRSDPDLIAVIEELGEEANGSCAELAITEIPDGAPYEIDEYDGSESVVPPRYSWDDFSL